MNHIIFFNHFHNGDIHVSRGFIRKIMSAVRELDKNTIFSYAHKNSSSLLSDIDGLGYAPLAQLVPNEHVGIQQDKFSIAVNTWYAQQNFKYMNEHNITFDCLYAAFNDHCKTLWNFSLEDISKNPMEFFPYIDYSKFEVTKAAKWVNAHPEKKIFISNGPTLSGQAENFSMMGIIEKIAIKHPDKTFILSNIENRSRPVHNIHWSSDIIGKKSFDLNENSFITTHCDLVVGRASGAFTFAFVKENLFIRYPKFLCFTNLSAGEPNKFWLHNSMKNKIHYNAEIIVKNENNVAKVLEIIDSYL